MHGSARKDLVLGAARVYSMTVPGPKWNLRLNLVRPGVAAAAALLSATIFLSGGMIGTGHHLYFSGTPTVALSEPWPWSCSWPV